MTKLRLFGTDGVRGRAGSYPLDASTVARIGGGLVRVLGDSDRAPRLLVGRDTRESGPWLEHELVRGAHLAGASCVSVGVLPTPAVAYLTRELGFDAGVMISASHNPFEDNGIKVFSGRGGKLEDRLEAQIESMVADPSWRLADGESAPPDAQDLADRYVAHVRHALPDPETMGPHRLALDCANGAMSLVAPRVFRELGFDVVATACAPDGRNINRDCGSTHPEALARMVPENGCRYGVAFDGDGDRAILVDDRGRIVDGDGILYICARHLASAARLRGNAVVATVMSNVGLELALRDLGIELVRCPVGDKHVMAELIRRDLVLGGEQSGHVILRDLVSTGDGLVTALSVLSAMAHFGQELAVLFDELTTYPQVLVNVRVRERREVASVPSLAKAIASVEDRLDGRGRVLVRYSGTEPLLRIMIEGPDREEIGAWAEQIADVARVSL